MIKKLAQVFVLSCVLGLSACTTTGGFDKGKLEEVVAQIQAFVQRACFLQPEAASLIGLITALYPPAAIGAEIVASVGNLICSAPTTATVRRGFNKFGVRYVITPRGPVRVLVRPVIR